jgi:polyisoprenoid-binding protein YceI
LLDAKCDGRVTDAYGKDRAAFSAETAIKRRDFGLNWNGVIEAGGVIVSDRVKITLHIAAVRQD